VTPLDSDVDLGAALQTLSLLIEVAGVILVVLDIYMPKTAAGIEDAIHRTSAFLTAWKERSIEPSPMATRRRVGIGSVLSGMWLAVVLVRTTMELFVWLMLWPLRLTLRGLDRLARGHALAGLGLVLSLAGLLLEVQQLVTG
jgi:hypothetical protein